MNALAKHRAIPCDSLADALKENAYVVFNESMPQLPVDFCVSGSRLHGETTVSKREEQSHTREGIGRSSMPRDLRVLLRSSNSSAVLCPTSTRTRTGPYPTCLIREADEAAALVEGARRGRRSGGGSLGHEPVEPLPPVGQGGADSVDEHLVGDLARSRRMMSSGTNLLSLVNADVLRMRRERGLTLPILQRGPMRTA